MSKCSVFKNSFSPKCEHEAPTLKILGAIKKGRWRELIEKIRECSDKEERNNLKKGLPCVTFSGTFNDTRKEKNIKVYSQLMLIDIDNQKNLEVNRFKQSLKIVPFIIT